MKKLTFSLIACFACFQALQADAPALTSPVNLSLQHYEAITHTLANNPEFQNIIPEGEFITNLRVQRRSINVTEGNVFVNITTRLPYKKRVVADRKRLLQEQQSNHNSHAIATMAAAKIKEETTLNHTWPLCCSLLQAKELLQASLSSVLSLLSDIAKNLARKGKLLT